MLDADGGGKGVNYKSASIWFRKAADRAIADSQFNLGILYGCGIGVEQNLAESFKWFSLAAARATRMPDASATISPSASTSSSCLWLGKPRDPDLYARAQPNDAVNVASPTGGLGLAPVAAAGKPSAKAATQTKRTASAH